MTKEQATREALEMALEALEESHPEAYRHVITAIKEALAESEQCTYPDCNYPCMNLPDCKQPEREPVKLREVNKRLSNHIVEANKMVAQPEQEPVAFPRNVQEYDEDWIIDPAFILRVKNSIDPETPWDFTPTMEQVEATLLALEVIPASLYTTPPQRKPLTYVDLRRIANQCGLGANEVSARTHATIDNFARAIEAAHGIIKE